MDFLWRSVAALEGHLAHERFGEVWPARSAFPYLAGGCLAEVGAFVEGMLSGQTESTRVALVTASAYYRAIGMSRWLPQIDVALGHVLSGT